MKGRKVLVLGLIGMLTLGLGSWSVSADTEETTALSEAAETAESVASSAEAAESAASSAEEQAKDTAEEDGIAGTYKMDENSFGEADMTDEDLEMLKALGGMVRLIIREDGTGAMEAVGQQQELEWNEKEIIMDGESVPYTYEKGVLTMGKDSEKIAFQKMTAEELEKDKTEPLQPGDYDPDTRAGYYKLSTVEENGEVTDAAVLSAIGMEVYLVLNEDNTGRMSLFDVPTELTWDEKTITMEGEKTEYTYDAGTVTLKEEGTVMTFVYAGTPDEAPEAAAEEENTDGAAAAESAVSAESTASSETAAENTTSAEEAAK